MKYNKTKINGYLVHSIKAKRYKTSRIEIIFQSKVSKDTLSKRAFLVNMFNEGSKDFPKRKDIAIFLEELYDPFYSCYVNKVGNLLLITFGITFISPEYINEKAYLEKIVNFLFKMILNPNQENKVFDEDNFNLVYKNILLDIDSINENPTKRAITSALAKMDNKSVTSFSILGTKEEIYKITRENLYETYLDMLENDKMDIFVTGNTDLEKVISAIKKVNFKRKENNPNISAYVKNKVQDHPLTYQEDGPFLQSELVNIYNVISPNKKEREVTFHVLNYLLGSGGLSSKLYKYIREEKQYCYRISSMYYKYDNLLCISSSLEKKNTYNATELIHKAINELANGNFTNAELEDAKSNLIMSTDINMSSPASILSNYEFQYFLKSYSFSKRLKEIKLVTKKDITSLALKIKENLIYTLNEECHEEN